MKCSNKDCENEAYSIAGKGGCCPTWEMARALTRYICIECAIVEVKKLRIKTTN